MAYSYQLLPEANYDLNDAVAWYHGKSQKTAQRFMDSYLKAVARVSDNPHQFPFVDDEIRKARFGSPFPYSIFFVIRGNTVVATAIFHDKQDPKIWQEERR